MSGGPASHGRAWRLLLALAVTLGLLAWLLGRVVAPGEMRAAFARLSPADLVRPLALSGVAFLLSALRWRTLLAGLGHAVGYRQALFAVLATWPVAVVTPSRSGDALRAALVRDRVPLAAGLGSVLLEKLLDLQSLALLVAAGALAAGRGTLATAALTAVLGFWLGLFLLPVALGRIARTRLRGRLKERLDATSDALVRLRRARGRFAAVVAMSLAAWLLSTAILGDLLGTTGQPVAAADLLLAWPAAVVAAVLPFALSGIGARDGVFLGLLSAIRPGVDPAAVLAATLLYPALTSWVFALVGLPFAARAFAADPALRSWLRSGPARGAPRHQELVDEEPVEDAEAADGAVDGEREARRDGDPQVR